MQFRDRQDAGQQLADALRAYKGKDVVVYAVPRGGVPVAVTVARALGAPLDVVLPRKIGHPYNPEYAFAAVSEHGDVVAGEGELLHVDAGWFEKELAAAQTEAKRRRELYAAGLTPVSPRNKTCIIVDDGLATGLTMKAAVKELRHEKPKQIIVAVPVAPPETIRELSDLADHVVALYTPSGYFDAVGSYYRDFTQVSDQEVVALMKSL